MAMSKKDFIALADMIRYYNANVFDPDGKMKFNERHLIELADFCQSQNPRFKRERWLGYIRGENGKNGGAVRKGEL